MRADDVYAILNKRIKNMQAPGGGELDWELLSKKLGTPVGEIISYMGTVAPEHYLICNGAEYNLEEYPELVQHFIDNFGSANYFGGDGETTFAVPDLRGEFLRGTGTATRNTGSGADVGVHQNPTVHLGTETYAKHYIMIGNSTENPEYVHETDTEKYNYGSYVEPAKKSIDNTYIATFTSRPTNTSVLYCIKCELV